MGCCRGFNSTDNVVITGTVDVDVTASVPIELAMHSTIFTTPVAANPTYSATQTNLGLLELIDLEYNGGIVAVTITIQEQVSAGVWKDRWATGSTNTNAFYLPVKLGTLSGGVAGTGEAHIPLRSSLGWRLAITGAVAGSVTAFVSLDQG